jgi:hypothetical protein
VGHGILIIDASWWHSNISHSVGLLWTSDRPIAKTSTWKHTALTRERHPCPLRDSNPQSHKASCRRPTPLSALPLGSICSKVYSFINCVAGNAVYAALTMTPAVLVDCLKQVRSLSAYLTLTWALWRISASFWLMTGNRMTRQYFPTTSKKGLHKTMQR